MVVGEEYIEVDEDDEMNGDNDIGIIDCDVVDDADEISDTLLLLLVDKVLKIVLSLTISVVLNINLLLLFILLLISFVLFSVDEKYCSLLLLFLIKDNDDDDD